MSGARNAPLINERIRAPLMQLILANGENMGVVTRDQALAHAAEAGLDLVIIADRGGEAPPIAKIMDFGKAEYEKKKKHTAAKKKQKVIKIKEIKLRPKIGDHDLQVKLRQGLQFLNEGMRLKISLTFRGREKALKHERGEEIFSKVIKAFEESDLKNLVKEKDIRTDDTWSRVYYLKEV